MSTIIEKINKFLPHREPFLFIDEVIEVELGKKIHCIKRNSLDEDYFRGHFPGNPVMPGVLILEALAQASGILGFKTMDKTPEEGSIYVFAGVDKARFRKRVGPEDVIDLFSEVVNEKKGIWKFETRAEVKGQLVCSATILCADRKTK
jgi:3-hydroxyacyl-[acyl-carrier-protein] dehydratase